MLQKQGLKSKASELDSSARFEAGNGIDRVELPGERQEVVVHELGDTQVTTPNQSTTGDATGRRSRSGSQ